MTQVIFELDLFDSEAHSLRLDLEELNDHCVMNDKDFREEFLSRVWNYMAYSVTDADKPGFEEIVYSMHLDVDQLTSYVNIDFKSMEDDRWMILATQLMELVDYANFVNWDNMYGDRLAAFLCMVEYDGWKWVEFTLNRIKDSMSNFEGVYDSKWFFVDEMIKNGDIDPIPDYVVFDSDATAESLEEMGYFSSYDFGRWQVAIWR